MIQDMNVEEIREPEKPPGDDWSSGWPQSAAEFDALIEMFQHRLIAYAFRRLRDYHEAEDVIQEVFVKAFTTRREMTHVVRVAPYLYRMAANTCTDRLRRHRPVMVQLDEVDAADTRATATQAAQAADGLKNVDRLLARLPDAQAEVLRLRVLDDLSLDEIAVTLDCPMETAKSRLRYGIAKLRRMLSNTREKLP